MNFSSERFAAVIQPYETDVGKEYVIGGNDALMKCSVPSHVADFVSVVSWIDSEGNEIRPSAGVAYGTLFRSSQLAVH